MFAADPKTLGFSFVSQEAENLLGYPVSAWTRDPSFWIEHLHPDDRVWAPEFCLGQVKAVITSYSIHYTKLYDCTTGR